MDKVLYLGMLIAFFCAAWSLVVFTACCWKFLRTADPVRQAEYHRIGQRCLTGCSLYAIVGILLSLIRMA